MKTKLPLFHLRRSLRQRDQELRRAQRAAVAIRMSELDAFADQVAAEHDAYVARLPADTQRHIVEAEGPPEVLYALRKQLH